MTTPQYRGSFPVLVTAFKEGSYEFDEAAMRRFVDWQVAEGSHGIVTLGSMGEFFLVDDADRRRIVRAVVDQAAKRIPVFVGTMSTRTENAARYSAEAEETGADGLMITPPFYLAPSDDEIFAYYEQICARVRIPIMLYNNPTTTNVDMSAKLVARLAHAFPQIRYIKEASGDLARGYDIRRLCGDKMNVWQGARPFESTFVGGNGWASPEGNFAPKLSARMYDHLFAGEVEAAERIRDVLVAVNDLIKGCKPPPLRNGLGVMVAFTKELCGAMGCPLGVPRPPMQPFAAYGERGREAKRKILDLLAENAHLGQGPRPAARRAAE